MINQRMYELGSEPSAIRELFAYGQARKAEINLQKINRIDHIMVYDMPIIEHDFSPLFDCQCTLTGNYPYVLR